MNAFVTCGSQRPPRFVNTARNRAGRCVLCIATGCSRSSDGDPLVLLVVIVGVGHALRLNASPAL